MLHLIVLFGGIILAGIAWAIFIAIQNRREAQINK